MFKLLNRLSYIISFNLGFLICFYFLLWNWWRISDDEMVLVIIFGLLLWLLIKKIFLSKKFIESRLEFFASALQERLKDNYNFEKRDIKHKVQDKNDLYDIPEYEKEEDKYDTSEYIGKDNVEEIINKNEEIEEEQEFEKTNYKSNQVKENDYVKQEEIKREPSQIEIAIKNFFSENILAKLWGILVFLWVLFLLGLVYNEIWPVWKIIIWFWIWFSVYFSWVFLDKKKFYNESKILLWIWILINYLVILWWRYLIDNWYLWEYVTFLFLILNTIFAVVTWLVYKSKSLLSFSFLCAFLNPFLIWWWPETPYTILLYGLIVSFWWLFLWYKQKDLSLSLWVFILWNILFLYAPIDTEIHWILKILSSTILSLSSIYIIYKLDNKSLPIVFSWAYVFVIFLLWNWESFLEETISLFAYMMILTIYFFVWIYYFLKTSLYFIVSLLFLPLLIILGLSFVSLIIYLPLVLVYIVLLYLVWFLFISEKTSNIFKYIFFILLWFFIFTSNFNILLQDKELWFLSFITIIFVSLIFMSISYLLSFRKKLQYLYSIWTIWTIFSLVPVTINIIINKINNNWNIANLETQLYISIITLAIFSLCNWLIPIFKLKTKESKDKSFIINILVWMITWLLFIWTQLYILWTQYFPWVTLWIAFVLLAMVYFVFAYFIYNTLWIKNIQKNNNYKNTIYAYLWISTSLFTLAMAIIFSKYDDIVSAIWLFEATILFFFYNKTKETKIYLAWLILFIIWVVKLTLLIDIVESKDYIFLVSFSIIFISYIINLKLLDFIKDDWKRFIHDLFHIFWIWTLWILLYYIIPDTRVWLNTIWISSFFFFLSLVYTYYWSYFLKICFIIGFISFMFVQFFSLDSIFWYIEDKNLLYFKALQYISTIIICWIVYIFNKINREKPFYIILNFAIFFYLLLITSYYVYDIFNTTFAITFYWWLTAFFMLFYWISKDYIKLRTIWLYIVILTTIKIFFYDIWFWIDDAVSRVLAFIVIWILLIIISLKYSKQYWNNLSWEFRFDNFYKKSEKAIIDKNKGNNTTKKMKNNSIVNDQIENSSNFEINEKIKDLDVSDIRWIKFFTNWQKNWIEIRAENLVRISKIISSDFSIKKFKKWELRETYEYVKNNYKSELSKATYDKILSILDDFVNKWWDIEVIYKGK